MNPVHKNNTFSPGEELGTVSHSVPVGVSGQYALRPHQTQPNRIPEQCTEVHGKSESKALDDDDDEDDYEKMQSYVGEQEDIEAWRRSHVPHPVSHGSFIPPSTVQSRRSEQISSHMPGSPCIPSGHQRHQVVSASGSTIMAASAPVVDSPWLQGAHNVNSNNCSGNTTPTSNSPHVVHNSPLWQLGQHSPSTASPQVLHNKQATTATEDDKDSTLKRVVHPSSSQLRKRATAVSSPATGDRRAPKLKHHDAGLEQKRATHASGSSGPGESGNSKSVTENEELSKVGLVKARLERLEKSGASVKPAVSTKPKPGKLHDVKPFIVCFSFKCTTCMLTDDVLCQSCCCENYEVLGNIYTSALSHDIPH